jgi:hypothetical protein
MIKDCKDFVNTYIEWLRQKISIEEINGICEITTPFLDRNNDHLQIYVKKLGSGLILTDDGHTITGLKLSGCEFTTEKRRQILHSILNGFGVRLLGDELVVEARPENFPQKKHNLIQAILSINDLFVMAAPMVASFFKEDVERFLRLNEIRFTPSINFTGRSGFVHFFDFVIPASKVKPERILKTINRPDKQKITSLIFSWTDTKEVRAPDSTAYGVLNDMEQPINPDLISALKQYEIIPLLWSQRDEYVKELVA